ncbi:dinitrogenase iron-molybdenum cofactor biosynthesis protein [Candidatus Woesearchaeota archaeon]|nr:dinitrogenase iron-molybdenum cofactor biosynthesis protein [Candidatus Woesearchaeota archaeon]
MENKTKIAISSTGNNLDNDIDPRFGRCPYFFIIEIEDKKTKHAKAIENTAAQQAGGAGITSAQIVADEGVDAVIAVNVGPRAFDVFSQLEIKIYNTEPCTVKQAVQRFIAGELKEASTPTGPMHMGMSGQNSGAGSGIGKGQGLRNTQEETRCFCEKCKLSMPAPEGKDCSQVNCPKCGSAMKKIE